jgi:ESCRT-I complex subunit TSG101
VYLPENFPATAPICYVHPTPSMIIKPGHPLVDGSGLVRSRYLDRWNVRAGSTIADLSTSLSEAFGDDPPLYAKPAGTSTHSTQSQSQSHSTYPAANAAGATYPAPPGRGGGPSYRAPHRPPHPSEATNAYGYPTSAPEVRSIHWFPYDRVRVVDADP